MLGEYAVILVGNILINNFVLVQFLGLCPFMGVSTKLESAIGMSAATTFVLTMSTVCSHLLFNWFLEPFGLEYLRLIGFILVIASIVQLTEMMVRKLSPLLYRMLGIFLPLITTNCAVLGVALLSLNRAHSLLDAAIYGFSAALGFALVLVCFTAMRERLLVSDIPQPFQGAASAMLTAGLTSLAFMGFIGVV